jgi:site-specific DNA-methyltransferase (adenine-specific)
MLWNGLELPPAYYQDDAVYIIHGDCRNILPLIPDKSIDLVLADPPYNVGKDYGEYSDDNLPEDKYVEFNFGWFSLATIKAKGIVVFPGIVNIGLWLSNIEKTHKIIAWIKENNIARNYIGATRGFNIWEPILSYGQNYGVLRDVINCPISLQNGIGEHPCPKPTKLIDQLLIQMTQADSLVLDPFLGSGTTAYCAKKLGRKCIGIEIEEKYCEIAAKRCSQSVMNFSLPGVSEEV